MIGSDDNMTNIDINNNANASIGAGPEKLAEWVGVFIDMIEDRMTNKLGDKKSKEIEIVYNILADIRNMNDIEVDNLYKEGWNEISSLVEEIFWMQERKFPLERLLIKNFSLLLADFDKAPQQGINLSRRVIPAFQYSLQQMVGPDMLHEYEDRSRNLIQQIRDDAGDNFEWSMVYNNSQANIITADILTYSSRYFTDVAKRRQWMIDIFHRMMPAGNSEAEKQWQFGDIEFHMLIGSLYNNLYKLLDSNDGIKWLQGRYGYTNFSNLKHMKNAFEIDRISISTN